MKICSDPADPTSLPVPNGCGGPVFSRGDCNATGGIDISDPLTLLGYLFGGDASPSCQSACDIDDGGSLDLSDAINLLSYLFGGGAPPAPPFGSCGVDPTPDALPCTTSPACP